MVKNRQCICCREKYNYCPNCSGADRLAPTWKAEFCTEPCATLWTTLTKYGMSMLTKAEAKDIISSLELKPIDAYVDCVKRDYDKVMAEDKKPSKTKRFKPVEVIIEQPVEVAEVAEPEHEVVIEKENE